MMRIHVSCSLLIEQMKIKISPEGVDYPLQMHVAQVIVVSKYIYDIVIWV